MILYKNKFVVVQFAITRMNVLVFKWDIFINILSP